MARARQAKIVPLTRDLLADCPRPQTQNEWLLRVPGQQRWRLTTAGRQCLAERAQPFSGPHPELVRLQAAHPELAIDLRRTDSKKFQAVHLLINHPDLAFSRQDLETFMGAIALGGGDIIQAVNKTDQWGLRRQYVDIAGQRYYYLSHPLVFDDRRLALRLDNPSLSASERAQAIGMLKSYMWQNFIAPAEFDLGHRDPDNPDAGLVLQPSAYNRSHRDRFKYDQHGLKHCPTASHLAANIEQFYPSPREQRLLLDALEQRLNQS